MRREVQVLMAMSELAESQRLAALDKLCSDIDVFVTRGRNAALSLYTSSDAGAPSTTSNEPSREISHALYAVTGVVSSLRELWTSTEGPSFSKVEVNILSNSLRLCAPILEKIDTAVKLDNEKLPGESSDKGPHRISKAFAAGGVGETKHILHACFHTVTEAVEDGKIRRLARDAAR
jgi:hypothetical protein